MAVGSLRCRRAALILLTLAGVCAPSADAPKAQTPARNGLQRLIAGEPLPPNAVSSVAARKAAAASGSRRRFVPGRVLLKTDGTQAAASVASLASRVGALTAEHLYDGDDVRRVHRVRDNAPARVPHIPGDRGHVKGGRTAREDRVR